MSMSDVTIEDRAGKLLLDRLLVTERRPLSRAALKKPLGAFRPRIADADVDALFEQTLGRLVAQGLISESPFALTPAGRSTALEFWQIERPPVRVRWEQLKQDFLLPRMLGLSAVATASTRRSKDVIGALLKQSHSLPDDVDPDCDSVLHALAWRQLGIESTERFTPEAVISRILLNSVKKASSRLVARQLAGRVLETSDKDLFPAALNRWIDADSSRTPPTHAPAPEPALSSLSQFAESTLAAADSNSSGRFGSNKVFISHVWNSLRHDPHHAEIPLPQFKQRLLDAHRQGLLQLSRADLVERMPADDLASSETNYFDAVFHFVCLT